MTQNAIYTISTHTPLAGRDILVVIIAGAVRISTHTPLAGRDAEAVPHNAGIVAFQLTRPSRGATHVLLQLLHILFSFQLTRPSRGATIRRRIAVIFDIISTHTPLAGRDEVVSDYIMDKMISTHTPLAGRDVFWLFPFVCS